MTDLEMTVVIDCSTSHRTQPVRENFGFWCSYQPMGCQIWHVLSTRETIKNIFGRNKVAYTLILFLNLQHCFIILDSVQK